MLGMMRRDSEGREWLSSPCLKSGKEDGSSAERLGCSLLWFAQRSSGSCLDPELASEQMQKEQLCSPRHLLL